VHVRKARAVRGEYGSSPTPGGAVRYAPEAAGSDVEFIVELGTRDERRRAIKAGDDRSLCVTSADAFGGVAGAIVPAIGVGFPEDDRIRSEAIKREGLDVIDAAGETDHRTIHQVTGGEFRAREGPGVAGAAEECIGLKIRPETAGAVRFPDPCCGFGDNVEPADAPVEVESPVGADDKALLVASVEDGRGAERAGVGAASELASSFAGACERWEEDADEERNDSNHHEKFDQRERAEDEAGGAWHRYVRSVPESARSAVYQKESEG